MKGDIADLIGAVNREVSQRDHEGRPARVVVASRTYRTTREDLWDAVTNPGRIPRWFLPISGELRLGGRYQLQGNAGGRSVEGKGFVRLSSDDWCRASIAGGTDEAAARAAAGRTTAAYTGAAPPSA